jgi:hypothetical protein
VKKIARRLAIILVFVLGLGYFLFSNLIYSPTEGSYMDQFEGDPEVALEYVIPREVDWFFHKRGLAADFEESEFPIPDLAAAIKVRKNFRRFAETEYASKLAESLALEATIEKIRAAVDDVPVIDPVADILGRDIAVFGRVKGFGYDHDATAAVFLGSSSMRFAYATTMNSMLRGLFGLPVEVEETEEGVTKLTLPDGQVLYTHREKDLFVVGDAPNLVREVMDLIDLGMEQSLGRTRGYNSTVAQDVPEFAGLKVIASDKGPSVEQRTQLHFRLPALFSQTEADERFLEPMGEVSRWLLARLFNPRYFNALTLDIAMEDAVGLKGVIGFDREMAESAKTGFYNRKTFELKKAMDAAADVLPDDTAFVMAARVDIKLFLPQIIDGLKQLDPHAVTLIDEVIASIRKVRPDFRALNATDAMRNFASFLGDDVVIAVKRDTYFGSPNHPLPLIAIFFEVTQRGPSFEDLKKANGDPAKSVGYNGFVFPIRASHAQLRAKSASIANWFDVTHFGTPPTNARYVQEVILAGTSDLRNVAFGIADPARKEDGPWQMVFVMSPHVEKKEETDKNGNVKLADFGTAQEFITDIINLHHKGDDPNVPKEAAIIVSDAAKSSNRTIRRLSVTEKYQQGGEFLDRFASLAMFIDARGLKEILADHANAYADELSAIDWQAENARVTEELMNGEFAAWKGKTMPAATQQSFEAKLQARKEEMERERVQNVVPRLAEEYVDGLAWVDLFQDAFVAARIDDKDGIIELGARIRTDLK